MGAHIIFLAINLLVFIGLSKALYSSNSKDERLELLCYLVLNIFIIIMLFCSLKDIKHYVKMRCKEYSVETIVTQFENKSDTTYVLHLKR